MDVYLPVYTQSSLFEIKLDQVLAIPFLVTDNLTLDFGHKLVPELIDMRPKNAKTAGGRGINCTINVTVP